MGPSAFDRICDDDNNNAGCSWDGGDCCDASNNFKFCSDCMCLDCTSDVAGSYKAIGGDDCVSAFASKCASKSFQADGFCDDGNNNGGCDWVRAARLWFLGPRPEHAVAARLVLF